MDAVNWSFRNFEFRILYLCDLKRIGVGLCKQKSAIGNLDLKLWERPPGRDQKGQTASHGVVATGTLLLHYLRT
jgi:hypothetical protein